MSFQTLLGLIFINLVWSMHPLMGKWLLLEVNPVQAAGIRYFSAFCAYVAVAAVWGTVSKLTAFNSQLNSRGNPQKASCNNSWKRFFVVPNKASEKVLIVVLGATTFCLSPLLQMRGLAHSLASENSLIIAIEPLLTIFLAWLILKESITRLDGVGFGLAILGFGFLAGVHPSDLWLGAQEGSSLNGHLLGNLLIALSLLGEAVFTIICKKLIRNYAPLAIFGSALAVGVVCMGGTLASITLWDVLSNSSASGVLDYSYRWSGWGWRTFLAGFWIGPLGTTVAYLIYMEALADIPVVAVVLFLFLQPLVGALLGYLFLAERLDQLQIFGSFLILLAILLPNAMRLRNRTAY